MQVPPSAELAASAQEIVHSWSPLSSHPNLNVPRASFITGEFEGGSALVVGHAFHPTAITLDQAHLQPTSGLNLLKFINNACNSLIKHNLLKHAWETHFLIAEM